MIRKNELVCFGFEFRSLPRIALVICVFLVCANGVKTSFAQQSAVVEAKDDQSPLNPAKDQQKVILVVGAAGAEEYGKQFTTWAENWQTAIESNSDSENVEVVVIGLDEKKVSDLEQLEKEIRATEDSASDLWIVLIGHGTDDRKVSKFNLKGRDMTAKRLNDWIAPLNSRVVVVNCTSASGGFISKLKGKNRVVITATKSAAQHNFARFGGYLSEAIADPALDLDKDQQTSLLEAVISASARTQEFYIQDTRLATELAMIDDNGDGRGTPADWFKGTRVVKRAKQGEPDGLTANQIILVRRGAEGSLTGSQRKQRDKLEGDLEHLRQRKSKMTEEAYYNAIEPILVELAKIYGEQ